MGDGAGFALGSVEGRASVEWFGDDPDSTAKRFAFKCHRTRANGEDVAYPVNAVAFFPRSDGALVFATGGAEGTVATWDGNSRKRLWSSAAYPCGVSSLAVDQAGTRIAVAASYTWERGDVDHAPDAIYVRTMSPKEVAPKASKKERAA